MNDHHHSITQPRWTQGKDIILSSHKGVLNVKIPQVKNILEFKTVGYDKILHKIIVFSIYHTSEQYFSRTLIGQLGGDQPSTIHLRAAERKQNGFCRYIFTNKVTLWAASYSACVVYTKTINHLSVGESGGYLPRRFAAQQISTTIHLHFGE